MANEKEYILGTDEDELSRLAIQHRIWADVAVGAWKRAGVLPGTKVLDLGCGPGHATFDLAQLVTSQGELIGADASERFTNYLSNQAKLRKISQIKTQIVDAENLSASFLPKTFDVVYTRWLLCWLRNPDKAVNGVVNLLKPGGRFVIHDYFNWKSMTTAPRSNGIEAMVAAAVKSFELAGGDIDIAGRLPKILKEGGLEIRETNIYQRIARGGGTDGTIAWPLTWWRSYGPKLVQMGHLSKSDYDQAARDMDSTEASSEKFFVCPPVYEFIAVRKH